MNFHQYSDKSDLFFDFRNARVHIYFNFVFANKNELAILFCKLPTLNDIFDRDDVDSVTSPSAIVITSIIL